MMKNKPAIHYTAGYLVNPPHPVTVNVIGCGGTGSQVITSLARMHTALKGLGHPGLYVTAIDPDQITEANRARQLFSMSEVGDFKATALITRVNRFFGLNWISIADRYTEATASANIAISCVDSGMARYEIKQVLGKWSYEHYRQPYYWMDFGNMSDRGQVVMGTIRKIDQPKQSQFLCRNTLPVIDDLHPDIFKSGQEDQGPSCSLAEALGRQDLFINTNLANAGLAILWKMFREMRIRYHGLYLNLETMEMAPIPIK